MLIQVILFGILLLGIIFMGAQLGVKIKELETQLFFWILYGVSILTLFLFILCCYIYITFRNKSGSLGPKGYQGNPGQIGDPGHCDQNLCRGRTLAILIEKAIEEHNKAPTPVDVKKKICGYITKSETGEYANIVNAEKLKEWNLVDVKIFRDILKKKIAIQDGIINKSNFVTVIDNTTSDFNTYATPSKILRTIGDEQC